MVHIFKVTNLCILVLIFDLGIATILGNIPLYIVWQFQFKMKSYQMLDTSMFMSNGRFMLGVVQYH